MIVSTKLLTLLAASSVIMFVASLIVIPWIISRMPEDYFLQQKRHITRPGNYPHGLFAHQREIRGQVLEFA